MRRKLDDILEQVIAEVAKIGMSPVKTFLEGEITFLRTKLILKFNCQDALIQGLILNNLVARVNDYLGLKTPTFKIKVALVF